MQTVEVELAVVHSPSVPFRLSEHGLRTQRDLLGLNDAERLAVAAECVVCRAVGRWKLSESLMPDWRRPEGGHNLPTGAFHHRIDPLTPSFPFEFVHVIVHGRDRIVAE